MAAFESIPYAPTKELRWESCDCASCVYEELEEQPVWLEKRQAEDEELRLAYEKSLRGW